MKKVFTNSAAQILTKIITIVIGLIIIKLLSNYLGVAGYGLYAKIHNYAAIFAAIADLGLFTITVRELSEHKRNKAKKSEIIANVTGIRIAMGVILTFFALGIALFLPGYNSPLALTGIAITQIFVIFGLIYSAHLSYLQAELKTEFSALATGVGRIINLALVVWVLVFMKNLSFDLTMIYIFSAALIGNIAMSKILGAYTNKFEKIRLKLDFGYIKNLLSKNYHYIVAMFLAAIFLRIDTFMISILEPRDIADEQVGYYAIPVKIVEIGLFFGTIFLNSMLPLLTDAYKKRNKQTFEVLIFKGFAILLAAGMGIAMIGSFLAPWIITLISDSSFTTGITFSSVTTLRVIIWSVMLNFLANLYIFLLVTMKSHKKLLKINIAVTLFNIIGNIILIQHFSILGAAIASVASQLILLIGCSLAFRKEYFGEKENGQ